MPNVTGVYIPQGVDGEAVRRALLEQHNIEIGTSFGPLRGRIWRIGTMGYNARADAVEQTLRALETVFRSKSTRFRAARRSMPPYRFTADVVGRAARQALEAAPKARCARSSAAVSIFARWQVRLRRRRLARPRPAERTGRRVPGAALGAAVVVSRSRAILGAAAAAGARRGAAEPRGTARLPRRPRAGRGPRLRDPGRAQRARACTRSRRSRRSTAGSPATRSAPRRRSSSAWGRA